MRSSRDIIILSVAAAAKDNDSDQYNPKAAVILEKIAKTVIHKKSSL